MPTSHATSAPTSEPAGFAAQAARLVEAARANERAVRDLEEAAQILAAGIDDLAEYAELGDAVGDLSGVVGEVRGAADEVRAAVAAAGELAQVREAAEQATAHVRSLSERMGRVAEHAAELDERLAKLDEDLTGALEHIDRMGLDASVARIVALERRVDRVLDLLTNQGDAYAARVAPQIDRLEAVAEHMDAPAMADELADVLATNYLVVELLNTMREQNAQASDYLDAAIQDWHDRHGGR